MLCQECEKKPTCIRMCQELREDLRKLEALHYREYPHSPKLMEKAIRYSGKWHIRYPEYKERLKSALSCLASDDKTLLRLRFEEGLYYREIGNELSLRIDQVIYRVNHIIERLIMYCK